MDLNNTPTLCPDCGNTLEIGDFPYCPHGRYSGQVTGDEIDVVVNAFGPPQRFTSREELMKVAKSKGYEPLVYHTPGDKHTSRWI